LKVREKKSSIIAQRNHNLIGITVVLSMYSNDAGGTNDFIKIFWVGTNEESH
jgi:hypothetical protein